MPECTPRFLRNLVDHLPPDSALHRARNPDGQQWTWQEEILWRIEYRLQQLDWRIKWHKQPKKPGKVPEFLRFPWTKKKGERIGDRGGRSSEDALAYFKSISPNRNKG